MNPADDEDMADVRWLIAAERLDHDELRSALDEALVPEPFADVYPQNRQRLLALIA